MISGGDGADDITGGADNDQLTGGAGNDTFNIDSGTDIITDLTTGDIIKVTSGANLNVTGITGFEATTASTNANTSASAVSL